MSATTSFSSLSKQHAELNALFRSHQRALFEKDIDGALAILTKFGSDLFRHIEFEERRLLPLYADQSAETAGGTLEIFQAEHRKLHDCLVDLMHRTEQLYVSTDLPGSILDLLDDESMFKSLFRHHLSREQSVLFPRLDERTTEEERKTWLTPD